MIEDHGVERAGLERQVCRVRDDPLDAVPARAGTERKGADGTRLRGEWRHAVCLCVGERIGRLVAHPCEHDGLRFIVLYRIDQC